MVEKFDGWRCNYLIGDDKKIDGTFYGDTKFQTKACAVGAILNTFDYDYASNGSFRFVSDWFRGEYPGGSGENNIWRSVAIKHEPDYYMSNAPNGYALPTLPVQQGYCVPHGWVESYAMAHASGGNDEWKSKSSDGPLYFNTSKAYKKQADNSQVWDEDLSSPPRHLLLQIEFGSEEDNARIQKGTLTDEQYKDFQAGTGSYGAIFPAGETNGRSLYYDVKNCERQDNMFRCNHAPYCGWSGMPVCKANFDHVYQKQVRTTGKNLDAKNAEFKHLVWGANSSGDEGKQCGQRAWVERDAQWRTDNCPSDAQQTTLLQSQTYMAIVEEMHNNHNECRNKTMQDCQRDVRCEVAGSYFEKGLYISALNNMKKEEGHNTYTTLNTEGNDDDLGGAPYANVLMQFPPDKKLRCDWWKQSDAGESSHNYHLGIGQDCNEDTSPFSCWNLLQTKLFKQMNVATRHYHNPAEGQWTRHDQVLAPAAPLDGLDWFGFGSIVGGTTRLTNEAWLKDVSKGGEPANTQKEWDYSNNGGLSNWMPGAQQTTLMFDDYWIHQQIGKGKKGVDPSSQFGPWAWRWEDAAGDDRIDLINPYPLGQKGEFEIPTGQSRPPGFPKNTSIPNGLITENYNENPRIVYRPIGQETFTQSFHSAASFPYYHEKSWNNDRHKMYHKVAWDDLSLAKTIVDDDNKGKGFAPFLLEFNKNPMDGRNGMFSNSNVDMIGAGLPFPVNFWLGTQRSRFKYKTDDDTQKYMGMKTCTDYWGSISDEFANARVLKKATSDAFYSTDIVTNIPYFKTVFHTPKGWYGSNGMVLNDFQFQGPNASTAKLIKAREINGYRAGWTNPYAETSSKEDASVNLDLHSEEHNDNVIPGVPDWHMTHLNSYSSGEGQTDDFLTMDQNYDQRIGSSVAIRW